MKAQEIAGGFAYIVKRERVRPLVGDDKIQTPIAVHVSDGDAARDKRLAQADARSRIEIPSVGRADKEAVQIAAAYIVTRLKMRPVSGVAKHQVIAHGQLVQLRPAIGGAFQETGGL